MVVDSATNFLGDVMEIMSLGLGIVLFSLAFKMGWDSVVEKSLIYYAIALILGLSSAYNLDKYFSALVN